MLTFSRAAATEFKKRLYELIGNAAAFVEIKTFHSYCFDLLGKIGSLENAQNVVREAAQMIQDGDEFSLVEALMERNDNMRVIAVGDDDQNIYGFRGSDSKYMTLHCRMEK